MECVAVQVLKVINIHRESQLLEPSSPSSLQWNKIVIIHIALLTCEMLQFTIQYLMVPVKAFPCRSMWNCWVKVAKVQKPAYFANVEINSKKYVNSTAI